MSFKVKVLGFRARFGNTSLANIMTNYADLYAQTWQYLGTCIGSGVLENKGGRLVGVYSTWKIMGLSK